MTTGNVEQPVSKWERRLVKQQIIIQARSIKAGADTGMNAGIRGTTTEFPTTDKSYFSDRYDWQGEKERLGILATGAVYVSEDDENYASVQNFKYHSMLLRRHIHRNHSNGRLRSRIKPEQINLDNYEIYTSEDESFGAVGNLTDQEQDFIELHTKDAVRLWTGKNDKKLGHKRYAGIQYVIPLSIQIWNEARNNNPFAYAALLAIETELDTLIKYLKKQIQILQTQLNKINQTGIHVSLRVNKDTIKIPVRVANLGFQLLELLTMYDELMRYCYTYLNKKIELNEESVEATGFDSVFELKKHVSSSCRIFNQNVYHRAMKIRSLKEIKCRCSDLLNDVDGEIGEKLSQAVKANMVEPLTPEILSYAVKLKSGNLKNPFSQEATQQLIEYARKHGLIVEENSIQKSDAGE